MKLNFSKEFKVVVVCASFAMCYAPQALAVPGSGESPLPTEMQQAKRITGVVSDATGPIIGASVKVKGTSNGAATDLDGRFTLNVQQGQTLVISYIGYITREVKIGSQSEYSITLEEDHNSLEEVVVVGYGQMKKSDISGASVSLGEDAVKGSIITSLDQSLQGRAAGVSAVQTSGAPGSASSIRVRGTATINANAEPLYVIDGVIVRGNDRGESGAAYGLGDALGNGSVSTISPLSTIDPADIVSMEILKDASATAIYGAQGANGVVLITTRHGKAGEAKFSYNGMVAASRQTKRLDMMNLREYAQFYNSMYQQGEVATANAYLSDPTLLGKGTNWQDAVFQTAWQHSHQVSAQGGTDKVQYYVSGSYMNQEGTIIGSEFNRLAFRANIDAELKKWLKMGVNISYSNSNDDLKLADSDEGLITYSLTTIPSIPIYNINGGYSSVSQEGYTNPNPIAMAMSDDILLNRQKLNGNIFFDVTLLKGLVWHTELGFDVNSSKGETYEPMINLGTWKRTTNSSQWNKNSGTFLQFKNYLTWNHSFGKHNVTGMVGQEAWESKYDYVTVMNTNLPSDEVHSPYLGQGTQTFSDGFGSSAMASFFTRWTYNFDNRYNATYTYRYDGSSNFGPNNRWAGFHSLAASWRFSNEKFFEPLADVISNGKLRVGWGQTGNANIGGYKWGVPLSTMESDLGVTYRPAQIANEDIKWESQEQWNVGLDLGFFNNRVNLTVDWYIKESKDMLMMLNLPSIMGTQGNGSSSLKAPWGNYGHIRNTGLEISLNTHPLQGKFTWDSDFQISFNKNKLVSLSDGNTSVALTGYGQWTDVVSYTKEGEALYNFYGYVTDGVYKDLKDLETSPKPANYPSNGAFSKGSSVWVGDIKYKDLNGDGVITEADRTIIGNPLPKFTFGWNNTFTYMNFDLNIFINGSVGGKIGNYNKMKLTHMNSSWTNQLTDVNNRAILAPIDPTKDYSAGVDRGDGQLVYNWYDDVTNVYVTNPGTSMPRASINDPNDNDRWSDRYIEDGSYVRLKNISLGYTFPKKMVKPLGLETLRLSCNIQNLLTITGYDGYDPEVGASTTSANVFGLDNGRYPSPTTYSFSLNVSF
ncbi:MAG: TonB-dependent receptor [Prevotella sp.]|nr:TonB-dependent receptor [Prevotella sp.]